MRHISKLAFAALCLSLAACGPSGGHDSPAPGPTAAAPDALTPEQITEAMAALPTPYSAANYDAGRRVFAQCRSCHTIDEGGGNRTGPNLHGLFGRPVGSIEGFAYSQAVQDADFNWDA